MVIGLALAHCGLVSAQAPKTVSTDKYSSIETTAKKRTQRMKDELFLSMDQTSQVMQINVDMLKKIENVNKQAIDKDTRKKQLAQIENFTKNKIVAILTPAQRQRFESALFAEIYQTKVDNKKALTVNKRK